MLIDSHCHLDRLDLSPYEGDLSKALDAARSVGVEAFLSISVDLSEYQKLVTIVETHPSVWMSVGVHPNDVNEVPTVETLGHLAEHPKVVAFGETGLDYYRTEERSAQQQSFRNHITAAKQSQKPLIIHTREAQEDTIRLLKEEEASKCGGVFHCFTESWEIAKEALDLGFYISLSGIVTFKNALALQEVAKKMPIDRLLVETDSPYLAPTPHRGKANYPAYVRLVAEQIALLRGVDLSIVAEQSTQNFYTLFKGVTKCVGGLSSPR